MATKVTVVDIFHQLTPAEKRKALAVLREGEQTVCERLGHSLKPAKQVFEWFKEPQTIYLCTRCGKREVV